MNGHDAQRYDGKSGAREPNAIAPDYIRFVALGDSASCGVGDPTPNGWRGWARILADAISTHHHMSFCKLAVPGATIDDVLRDQLAEALDHRPHIASLVVGLNDVIRSTWDPDRIREDLLHAAGELARAGALLITVRYHDHTRVLGLPGLLARMMRRRIETLNEIYDDVHEQYGTLRLDLGADPSIYSRELWAADRLHPSELGHRYIARLVGAMLLEEGLAFGLPSLTCTSEPPSRKEAALTLAVDVAPWIARRMRDLVPWAAHQAYERVRGTLRAASSA